MPASSQPPPPPPLTTVPDLVRLLGECELLEPAALEEVNDQLRHRWAEPRDLARELLRRDWLTPYQANQLLRGRGRELLLGSYVLLERLGEGGMGQVFKARHRQTGRVVALKLVRRERLDRPGILRRFRREVRAAARLSHPNIVAARGAGRSGHIPFLVLEYVEGITLAQLLQRRGPLPVREACDYVRQAALGLQHAHKRGLVHRDVKPANLLLSTDGVIKLLDLGLARLPGVSRGGDALTRVGAVLGTADFVAPEQVTNSRRVDARADLYGLGCTFYTLLAGCVPFPGGEVVDKLVRHQREDPAPLERLRPGLPAEVTAVVRRLTAKRPEDRFPTAAELAAALDELLKGLPAGGAPCDLAPAAPSADTSAGLAACETAEAMPPCDRERGRTGRVVAAAAALAHSALAALFGRRP